MADNWTPMRNDLRDDPAVVSIALMLDIDPDTVVGKLLRVWAWAGDHTTTGKMPGVTQAHVDHAAGAQGFGDAMRAAGWLGLDDSGSVVLPRFSKHNGKSAKKRLQDAKRASRYRVTQASRKSVTKSAPTEHNSDSTEQAQNKCANPLASGAESSGAGIALAARQTEPARTPSEIFDISQILRGLWPKSGKAHSLATNPNATPARVCWLWNRIRHEKPARPPGFMQKGILEGWEVPPEWVFRFEAAAGIKPKHRMTGGVA